MPVNPVHPLLQEGERLRIKIKADIRPPTRQTGFFLQTDCFLEPRCITRRRKGEEDATAAQGCLRMPSRGDRRDAQWQMAAPDCHTHLSWGLGGDRADRLVTGYHSYRSPIPPCQGDLALSQQQIESFSRPLIYQSGPLLFLFPQEQHWISTPNSTLS